MSSIGQMVEETKARQTLKVGDKVYVEYYSHGGGSSITPFKVTKRTKTRIDAGGYTFTEDGHRYPRESGSIWNSGRTTLHVATPELDNKYLKQRRAVIFTASINSLHESRNELQKYLSEQEKVDLIEAINFALNRVPEKGTVEREES